MGVLLINTESQRTLREGNQAVILAVLCVSVASTGLCDVRRGQGGACLR